MKTYNLLVLFRPGYLPHDLIFSYLRQVTARTPNKTSQLLVTLMIFFLLTKLEQKPNLWTYYFVEVSGHNFETYQTWGFRIQYLHFKLVSNHFCSRGRGVKSSRSSCEYQGGKHLWLMLQLRPRIWPLGKQTVLYCSTHWIPYSVVSWRI